MKELGAAAVIDRLFHVDETPGDVQYFYLGRVERWTGPAPDSPELADAASGEHHLDPIPLPKLAAVDLLPESVARLLRAHAVGPEGLAGLPTLTRSAAARPR